MQSRLSVLLPVLTAVFLAVAISGVPELAEAQILLDKKKDDEKESRKRKRRRGRSKCKDGKKKVDGQCCWAGQSVIDDECAGVPTGCPEGRVADAGQQACIIAACEPGMVRQSDDVHCCWPGQKWSKRKKVCRGEPDCPTGFVASGDSCDGDPDKDRVFGAADKCPDEAEDADNFDDLDGCPDHDNDKDGVCDPWVAELGVSVLSCVGSDMCADVAGPERGCPAKRSGVVAQSSIPSSNPPDVDEPSGGGPAWWSWAVAGGGVAIAGTGVALHFLAEGKRDDVRSAMSSAGETPVTSLTRQEALDLEAEANTLDTTGVILMGVGGAVVVGGALLVVLTWDSEESTSVSGVLTPNGDAMVVIGGRF